MEREERKRLRRLLLSLQRANLNRPKRRKTFMEVAGVERREVTVSKILAFLLDSEAEHGLGDLWLRSLLSAAAAADGRFDPTALQVSPSSTLTEVVTANVNESLRIDVVASTPDLVLGIENKIGASLYNNLGAYAGQVLDMAGGRTPLLLTLTLRDETEATADWSAKCEALGVALCNVTYDALFARVKEGAGGAMLSADREWLGYMRDFMMTIENLGASTVDIDRELFDFIGENKPEVFLMRAKIKEISRITKAQCQRLCDMLVEDEEVQQMRLPKPRIWQPSDTSIDSFAYFDVPLYGRGQRIHPEIKNNITDMRIQCYVSNSSAKAAVVSRLREVGIQATDLDDFHVLVRSLPLETPEDFLVSELKDLLKALHPIIKM